MNLQQADSTAVSGRTCLVYRLSWDLGAQPLPQALSSAPPRTPSGCFYQRIVKEESALVRDPSNALFPTWGCRCPESGGVLPKVTEQGWSQELLILSLLLFSPLKTSN